MSGIVGLFELDGAPVNEILLSQMTDFLSFRGPDEKHTWVEGPLGLGHTLLRTTEESEVERQPFSLDDRFWIVADARVDAQKELIAKLEDRGESIAPGLTDAELILRAYRIWGEDCVDHLLGDFVFAIWDKDRQRLFAARDQLGVKPFYYSQAGETILFSNSLDCLRRHPAVSIALNDLAIADFLLFGVNQESNTTSFAGIQRLPAAHCVRWSREGTCIRKYWTLPIEEPVYFKRSSDYIERLLELLRAAVDDRLRTNRVGIFMSGGLDSPALAAITLELLRDRSREFSLQALTSVYDELIPDSERHYAELVAKHLDIPIHYDVRDHEISINNWNEVTVHTPEPVANPMAFAAAVEFSKKISVYARVFFYGEGPDNSLSYEWQSYVSHLTRTGQWSRLILDLGGSAIRQRRLPLLSWLPRKLKESNLPSQRNQTFPVWLDEEFASRLGLRDRWAEFHQIPKSSHPVRPKSYQAMASPLWQALFESCDLTSAWGRSEMRHPFVDLRLLQYFLGVPAVPWCRNKLILRQAMRNKLPQPVINREKVGLAKSPDFARVETLGFPQMLPNREFLKYVNATQVPSFPESVGEFRSSLRAFGLNYWIKTLRDQTRNHNKENS